MGKKVWIEALRIFALFWVLYNHTATYGWTLFSNSEVVLSASERSINFLLFAFCKISVPLFLMISGALLLGRDESRKKNLRRVLRITVLIMLVAMANFLYFHSIHHEYTQNIHNLADFIKTLYGSTTLCTYYLWLYLGFLLSIPFLREIAKKRELVVYATVGYIVLAEVLPVFELCLGWPSFNLKNYGGIFAIYYICPLVGYWIDSAVSIFSKKTAQLVNVIAVVSLLVNAGIGVWAWELRGVIWILTPVILSACLFYDAKYLSYFSECKALRGGTRLSFFRKMVLALSPQTMGAFLVSGVLMCKVFGVYTVLVAYIPHTLAAFAWVLVALILCQTITAVIRLIPFMKRLL